MMLMVLFRKSISTKLTSLDLNGIISMNLLCSLVKEECNNPNLEENNKFIDNILYKKDFVRKEVI